MGFFKKKIIVKTYDKDNKKPVIKASICNGEQVAGFKDIQTGKIEEVIFNGRVCKTECRGFKRNS